MLSSMNALLRAEGVFTVGRGRVPWVQLVVLMVVGGFVYGACMGTYNARPLQALYSGLKVPMLLGVTTLICLPSFYVINTLLGLRADFSHAMRGILTAQATMAISLASLAPVIAVVYVSSHNYAWATLYNGALFALATLVGQITLIYHYKPLIRMDSRHRISKNAWLALYVFVAIQMAWVLIFRLAPA